jgi:hypothetical protein
VRHVKFQKALTKAFDFKFIFSKLITNLSRQQFSYLVWDSPVAPCSFLVMSVQLPDPIIVSFSSRRKLVHATLSEALWGQGYRHGKACSMLAPQVGGWSETALTHGVLFDLSAVQWCDLTACVHLLLVLERALKDQLPYVGLALPDSRPSPRETALKEEWIRTGHLSLIQGLADKQRRRSDALRFLEKIGFREAARCLHLPEVIRKSLVLLDDFGSHPPTWTEGLAEKVDQDSKQSSPDAPFVYELNQQDMEPLHPHTFLRWIPVDISAENMRGEAEKLGEKISRIAAHKHRTGLGRYDADTLVHVIFHELFQNAQHHAGPGVSHCIVGIWARKTAQLVIPEDYLMDERRFYEQWVKKHDFPLIEMAIGDSGKGILQSLRPAFELETGKLEGVPSKIASQPDYANQRLLFWSMARWSSCSSAEKKDTRGTRGLYRVKRLARSYQSLLTVRSGTLLAGWDWGGLDQPEAIYSQGRSWVPGTLIQIRFVSQDYGKIPHGASPLEPEMMEYLFGQPLELSNSIHPHQLDHLRDMLSRRDPGGIRRCVILPISSLPKNAERRKTAFTELFRKLRPMANPGALVLLAMGLPPQELSIHIDSFNQQITDDEQLRWAEESYDPSNPFWVLDRELCIHWAGVCMWELPLLRKILPDDLQLWERDTPPTAAPEAWSDERALSDYRQQADLFAMAEDKSLTTRFTPADIRNAIVLKTTARLIDSVDLDPRREEKEHYRSGAYLTPSLQVTNGWIDVPLMVREFAVFQTSPSALASLDALPEPKDATAKWQTWRNHLTHIASDQFEKVSEIEQLDIESNPFRSGKRGKLLKQVLDCLELPLGTSMVTHALALKVRQVLSEKANGETWPGYVLREPGTMDEVSGGLRRLLGLPRRTIELPEVGPLKVAEEVWEIIENQCVLIYSDTLVSESGVMRIISQVVKQNAIPVAVACILDLRHDDQLGKPLMDAGLEIPVISLGAIRGFVKQTDPQQFQSLWQVVNPTVGASLTHSLKAAPGYRHPISEEQMFQLMVDSQSLRFGHFILPQNRHFLFLVDPAAFLGFPQTLEMSREAIQNEWQSFKTALPSEQSAIEPIILLEAPGWTLEHGLAIFGEQARSRLHVVKKTSDRSFLRDLPDVSQRPVLLLLWSSITGSSAQQFVYQLANEKAISVMVITWLCRMTPIHEEIIRGWRELAVTIPPEPQGMLIPGGQDVTALPLLEYRNLPVRFRFLARGSIPSFGSHDCPVCQQRDRIGGELKRYRSTHLRDFAERYVQATRPEDMSFMPEEPEDLISLWCNFRSDFPPIMLELRTKFERMRADTRARLEMRAELSILNLQLKDKNPSAITKACALLCLVAIETDWLKEPPLSFPRVRAEISAMALILLTGNLLSQDDDVLLRHIIVALRSSSKTEFARALPVLFDIYHSKTAVLEQLLYDTFSYLDQPYHRTSHYLEPMADSLEKVCDLLREQRAGGPDESDIESTVNSLSTLAVEYLARAVDHPTPEQAWLALRQFLEMELADNHHPFGLCAKSFRYQPPKQPDETLGSIRFWGGVKQKWQKAKDLIQRQIAPRISVILPLLKAPYAESHFVGSPVGVDRLTFLHGLSEEGGGPELLEMDQIMDRFSQQPPHLGSKDWARYSQLRRMIREMILEPLGRTMTEGGAVLLNFLGGCPCYLGDVIYPALDSLEWTEKARTHQIPFEPTSDELAISVFCHEEIIKDLIAETLHNALMKHRVLEVETAKVHIEIGRRDISSRGLNAGEDLCLIITNFGSSPEIMNAEELEGGKGLERLRQSLHVFGGDLFHGHHLLKQDEISTWDYRVVAFLGKET